MAANELDKILAPVNELIRSVWSDELENLKDEKQAILSLIESEKVKAVEPFRQAMVNKGSHPEYHDQQVAYLKQHWPTLYNLLKELESKESAKREEKLYLTAEGMRAYDGSKWA